MFSIILSHNYNITKEHTVCFRAVDAEEMVVAPQDTITVLYFCVACHRSTVDTSSTQTIHSTMYNC